MRQAYDDYVNRNWKPNTKRLPPVSGCACSSCQHHRQLQNEWDKNQAQAREFARYLHEQPESQVKIMKSLEAAQMQMDCMNWADVNERQNLRGIIETALKLTEKEQSNENG